MAPIKTEGAWYVARRSCQDSSIGRASVRQSEGNRHHTPLLSDLLDHHHHHHELFLCVKPATTDVHRHASPENLRQIRHRGWEKRASSALWADRVTAKVTGRLEQVLSCWLYSAGCRLLLHLRTVLVSGSSFLQRLLCRARTKVRMFFETFQN